MLFYISKCTRFSPEEVFHRLRQRLAEPLIGEPKQQLSETLIEHFLVDTVEINRERKRLTLP